MLKTRMNGFALIVLAVVPGALAQDSTPLKLSLKDAVALALRQNPQVILANLDISDRKSTRLNSSHLGISYAGFCLKRKKRLSAAHSGTTTALNRYVISLLQKFQRLPRPMQNSPTKRVPDDRQAAF